MIDHIIREIPFTAQQPLSIDSLNSLSIKRANAAEDGYLSKEDFVRFNNAASNPTTYTLPIASSSTLGGVKIGTGFLMNSTSGILSVDSASFPQYNLPIASSTTLGGLKIGDGLSVNSSGLVSVNFPTQTTYTLPKADAETLGGIKIGRSLSIDPDGIANIILPTAANSVLGGVKVGDGLLIDANGVLSVAFSSYTLPTASPSILGGIKIGAGLNIAADGTLSINGSATSDSRAWHQGGDVTTGNGLAIFGDTGTQRDGIDFVVRGNTVMALDRREPIASFRGNDIQISDLWIGVGKGRNKNIRIGKDALIGITSVTTGADNIAIGTGAGSNLATGSGNIRIGNEAGVYMGEANGTIVIQGGTFQAGTDEPANRLIMTQQGNWGLGVAQFADVNAKLRVRNFDKTFIQTWVSSDNIEVASLNNTGLFNVDAVQIRSGTPLDGRVLTATDANGNATWRPLPTASATTPGLIKVGDGLTMTNGVLSVSTSGTSNYVLPTASSTTLGGIKIGTGFTMNATSGVLSVDFPTQTTYTLPTASNSVLGGVKIGTDLAIDANGIVSVNFPAAYVLPTASNTILGGVKVGTGLAIDTGGLLSVTFPAPYVLPIATGLELGGFKVGSGFFMSENGVLSVTFPAAYSLPTASATVLGGVKIGSRLSIDASGVLSADVQAGTGGTTDSLAWHQSGDALTANKFMGDNSAAGYSVDFITKNVTRFKLESDVVNYGYAMKVSDDLLINNVLIGKGTAITGSATAILFQALDTAATASSQNPEMRMVMRTDGRWGVGVANTNEIISKFHVRNNSSTAAIQSWMNPNNERVAYISNQGFFEVSSLRVRGASLPITGGGGGTPAVGKVLMATDADGSCTWSDIPGGSSAWQVGGQSLAATSVFGQTNAPGQDIQFKVANADRMVLLGVPFNRASATFTDDIRVNGVHIGIGVGTNNNQRVGINALFSVTSGYNNVASGTQTLGALTTGYNNTATGYLALSALTSGADNSAIGSLSLRRLTTGSSNMALGSETMDAATTGSANVAIGHRAMFQTTTGGCNVGAGYMAHYNLTTGNLNTALGFKAANNVGVNAGNLYLGAYAGEGLGDTTDSVVFQAGGGNLANSFTPAISASKRMMMNSSGNWGVGVTLMTDINAKFHIRNSAAATALQAWTNSGNLQVASMTDAGLLSVTNLQVVGGSPSIGKYLTSSDGAGVCAWTNLPTASATQLGAVKIGTGLAIDGNGTLSTSDGDSATAWQVGGQALTDDAVFGQRDTFGKNIDFYVGNVMRMRLRGTITSNRTSVEFTDGITVNGGVSIWGDNDNTRIGYAALQALATGTKNTAIGAGTLLRLTTGQENTAVGVAALNKLTIGRDNTAVGMSALQDATGNHNTAVGFQACAFTTTGNNNTALGESAMQFFNGSYNIGLGWMSGGIVDPANVSTTNGSIYLGVYAGYSVAKEDNSIVIQTGAPIGSGGVITGPGAAALSVLMNGQGNWGFGINQFADIGAKLHVVGNILATGTITSSSDRRLKRNIVELPDGLSAIMTLNPVKYEKRYDLDSDKYAGYEAGFVADDVREKFPYLIEECGQDKLLALNYNGITAVLVKAVQELLTNITTNDKKATQMLEEVKDKLDKKTIDEDELAQIRDGINRAIGWNEEAKNRMDKLEAELKKKDEEVIAAEDAKIAAQTKAAADKAAADTAIAAAKAAASQATNDKAAADAAKAAAEAKAAEEAKKAADAQAALDAANKALADMKAAKEAAEARAAAAEKVIADEKAAIEAERARAAKEAAEIEARKRKLHPEQFPVRIDPTTGKPIEEGESIPLPKDFTGEERPLKK